MRAAALLAVLAVAAAGLGHPAPADAAAQDRHSIARAVGYLRATQNADGTSHDWLDGVLAFEVVDSRVRSGVANLRAEIAWQRKSRAAQERVLP